MESSYITIAKVLFAYRHGKESNRLSWVYLENDYSITKDGCYYVITDDNPLSSKITTICLDLSWEDYFAKSLAVASMVMDKIQGSATEDEQAERTCYELIDLLYKYLTSLSSDYVLFS